MTPKCIADRKFRQLEKEKYAKALEQKNDDIINGKVNDK